MVSFLFPFLHCYPPPLSLSLSPYVDTIIGSNSRPRIHIASQSNPGDKEFPFTIFGAGRWRRIGRRRIWYKSEIEARWVRIWWLRPPMGIWTSRFLSLCSANPCPSPRFSHFPLPSFASPFCYLSVAYSYRSDGFYGLESLIYATRAVFPFDVSDWPQICFLRLFLVFCGSIRYVVLRRHLLRNIGNNEFNKLEIWSQWNSSYFRFNLEYLSRWDLFVIRMLLRG